MLPRLLWALKTEKIRRARILLLGIAPEYRGKGVDAMLYHWIWTQLRRARHLPGARPGWILEDNPAMNAGLEKMTFRVYKTYRLYDRSDMKALVTGATGFVGSHLTEALRRRGDEVTALARSAKKAEALRPLGVRIIAGDLDDTAALAKAVEGQDVVYHVAGVIAALQRRRIHGRQSRRHAAHRGRGRARPAGRASCSCRRWRRAGPSPRGTPLQGDEPPQSGDGLRPEQARGGGGGEGEHAAVDDRPPADGLRPARPRGAQGVPHRPVRHRAGVRRRRRRS